MAMTIIVTEYDAWCKEKRRVCDFVKFSHKSLWRLATGLEWISSTLNATPTPQAVLETFKLKVMTNLENMHGLIYQRSWIDTISIKDERLFKSLPYRIKGPGLWPHLPQEIAVSHRQMSLSEPSFTSDIDVKSIADTTSHHNKASPTFIVQQRLLQPLHFWNSKQEGEEQACMKAATKYTEPHLADLCQLPCKPLMLNGVHRSQ